MHARLMLAEGDVDGAVSLARERLNDALAAGWPYEEVAARVALAETQSAIDREQAARTLAPAVAAAARSGLVRTVVDGGPAIAHILGDLNDLQRRGHWPNDLPVVSSDYLRKLLRAVSTPVYGTPALRSSDGGRRALPEEPLSAREIDMLRLLDRGLSNNEIARSFGLKLNTVKWYLKNIYTKFGVTRRGEAVAEARRRRLID